MNSSLQLDLALDSLPRPSPPSEPRAREPLEASVLHLTVPLSRVPVDFFADPDGAWDFEGLVTCAGFQHELGEVAIGALTETYAGFPAGAAVIAVSAGQHISVALVDCTRDRALRARSTASADAVQ